MASNPIISSISIKQAVWNDPSNDMIYYLRKKICIKPCLALRVPTHTYANSFTLILNRSNKEKKNKKILIQQTTRQSFSARSLSLCVWYHVAKLACLQGVTPSEYFPNGAVMYSHQATTQSLMNPTYQLMEYEYDKTKFIISKEMQNK